MSLDVRTIDIGSAYAAKFLNEAEVERIGVLVKRDLENELVELLDVQTGVNYIRTFTEIWDVDHAVAEQEDTV
jgi:hypothetical protein